MRSQSQNAYLIFVFVNPNQKKISLYMAFHAPFIITYQHMRIIFFRYGNIVTQHL